MLAVASSMSWPSWLGPKLEMTYASGAGLPGLVQNFVVNITSAGLLDLADLWTICCLFGGCAPGWDGAPSLSKIGTRVVETHA
ncbi:hypothetical protein Taro_017269 [Colocasia esculenta]|uniref:Uncharacterized protein n=1 Tax=Colocasia esculenta TaxID=4460 RepID=A0A843UMN3_COLES|nr:hypothetical protein [Colocasia esculenta]